MITANTDNVTSTCGTWYMPAVIQGDRVVAMEVDGTGVNDMPRLTVTSEGTARFFNVSVGTVTTLPKIRGTCGDWCVTSEAVGWSPYVATSSSGTATMKVKWTWMGTADEWTQDCELTRQMAEERTWRIVARHTQAVWNWDATDDTYYCNEVYPDPERRLRQMIRERMAPTIITSKRGLEKARDIREERARETLARVIGLEQYQGYLKKGFIVITGKSGLRYQIFPGHGITKVFNKGELVERLCVVLRGDFPPTDSLIMRYLLILNDENKFRGYAIKHQVYAGGSRHPEVRQGPPPPPLTELYKNLQPPEWIRRAKRRPRQEVAVNGSAV